MVLFYPSMHPSEVWIRTRHLCVFFHRLSFLVTGALWPLGNITVYSQENENERGNEVLALLVN